VGVSCVELFIRPAHYRDREGMAQRSTNRTSRPRRQPTDLSLPSPMQRSNASATCLPLDAQAKPVQSEINNKLQCYADFLQQRPGGRCGAGGGASSTWKTTTERTMKKTNEFLLGLRLHGEADRRRRKRSNLQKSSSSRRRSKEK